MCESECVFLFVYLFVRVRACGRLLANMRVCLCVWERILRSFVFLSFLYLSNKNSEEKITSTEFNCYYLFTDLGKEINFVTFVIVNIISIFNFCRTVVSYFLIF